MVLNHLPKHQFQPRRRSRGWLASTAEHRRRLRKEFQHAPSLQSYAREEFEEKLPGRLSPGSDRDRLAADALPHTPPYTLEQSLDPAFLPD